MAKNDGWSTPKGGSSGSSKGGSSKGGSSKSGSSKGGSSKGSASGKGADAEVLVAINGDDSNLTAALKRASNRIAIFGHQMNGKITEGLVDPTKKAKMEFKDVSRIVGGIVVSKIFYGALGIIRDVTDAVSEFNTELEYTKMVYSTMFQDTSLADEFTNVLKDFSAKSPFSFSDSSKAARQLLSYGMESKNLMYVMQGVMNAASVIGDSSKIESISRALGQIFTKGVLKQEEVRQLAEAGIPAYDILREKLNLTAVAMQDISEQAIPAGVAINDLIDGINERFGSVQTTASNTMQGMVSNIKDNALLIGNAALEPVFQSMRSIIHYVDILFQKLREITETKGLGGLFEYLVPDKELQSDIRHFLAIIKELAQILTYVLSGAFWIAREALIAFMRTINVIGPVLIHIAQLLLMVVQALSKYPAVVKTLTTLLTINVAAWTAFKTAVIGAKILAPVTQLILECAKALRILAVTLVAHPLIAGITILTAALVALGLAHSETGKKIKEFFKELTAWNGIDPGKQILPDTKERTANLEKFNEKLDTTQGLLDATAVAAEKAAKKAKKAQKDLLSFDEVFKLQQQDETETTDWTMPDFSIDVDPFNLDDVLPDFTDFDGLSDILGLDDFEDQLDKIRDALKDIIDTFVREVGDAISGIGSKIQKFVEDLGKKLQKFAEDLGKDFQKFKDVLAREAENFVSWATGLKDAAQKTIAKWQEYFQTVLKRIGELWQQFQDELPGILSGAGLGALIGNLIAGPLGAALGAAAGAIVGHFWNKFADYLGVTDKYDASIAGALLGAFMALAASLMGLGGVATVLAGLAGYFGGLFWEGVAEWFGLEGIKKEEAAISSAIGAAFGFLTGLLQGGPYLALLGTLAGAYAGEFWSVLADNMGLTAAAKYAAEIAYGLVAVAGLALTDASPRTVLMFAGLAKDWIAAIVQGVQTGDWSGLTTAFASTLGALAYGPIGAVIGRGIASLYNVTYNAIKEHFGIDNTYKIQDLITASISGILTGLGAAAIAGLTSFGGQFGINLTSALQAGLKAGFAGFAVSLAASALSNILIDYLAQEFGKTKEDVERGKTYGAIGGVAGALVGSFFGPVGTMIGTAIGTLAGSLAGLFASDIVPVLTEFFTVTVPGIWNDFWGKVTNVINNFPYYIGVVAGHIANFFVGIGSAIMEGLSPIIESVQNFVSVTFPQAVAAAANWVLNLPTTIQNFLSDIASKLGEWFGPIVSAVQNFFTVTLPQAFDAAVTWILDIPNKIGELINGIVEALPGMLESLQQTIVNFISVTLPQMVATAANWILNLPTTIQNFISDIATKFNEWFVPVVTAVQTFFTTTLPQALNTAWQWLINLPETIATWFSGVQTAITNALNTAAQAIVQFISVTFKEWVAQGATWILKLGDAIYQIGVDCVQGFINGIMSIPLVQWCVDFVNEIIRGWKDTFGVNSPSTVFYEIGANVVQGFINGITELWDTLTAPIGALIDGFISLFTDGFGGLGATVAGFATDAGTSISTFVTDAGTGISTWVSDTASNIGTWASDTASNIGGWASEQGSNISSWATETGSSITSWASEQASNIGNWVSETTSSVTTWASDVGTSISTWATEAGTNISTWATDAATNIKTYVDGAKQNITDWANNTKQSITTWASNTKQSITTWVSNTQSSISTWVSNVQTKVSSWSTTVSTTITTWVSSTKSSISGWISETSSSISTWVSNFTSRISSATSTALGSINSFVSSAASAISGWASSAFSTISNVVSKATKAASDISSLPGHATGGIFTREHIARVSEGNKPEAIIPLQDAGAMQPFVDAVAGGLAQYLGPVLSSMQDAAMQPQYATAGTGGEALQPLYVGTLIADDRSLRELERKMNVIRMSENNRIARSR